MTPRERINRDGRRTFLVALIGFAMFVGGMMASKRHPEFKIVAISGFVLFVAATIYVRFAGRCVHCHRPLGRLWYGSWGTAFGLASELQFCPYCGKSLDDDVGSNQSLQPTADRCTKKVEG
jgi:hypothetical protein